MRPWAVSYQDLEGGEGAVLSAISLHREQAKKHE